MKGNQKDTKWYVVTGGPSTGKTTLINDLKKRGYNTTIEHARHYIDTMIVKGKTIQEIRENNIEFQLGVLNMQIEQEASIPKNELFFLDRAIPDALAYYRFLDLEIGTELDEAIQKCSYQKIFILDRLPLVDDYARIENKNDQVVIHKLITEVYEALPFPVVRVPVLAPAERVEFVLNNLSNN